MVNKRPIPFFKKDLPSAVRPSQLLRSIMSASEQTAEQAKADHVAKMGSEIGLVYSALWQEVARINQKWAQYVALFGTSPERIELLNRAAPSMIRTVQDTLWGDVLLHLARLNDSPKSTGKANLSVQHLADLLKGSPVHTTAESLSVAARKACEFARDWRNRRLAHSDLDLALGDSVQPLASASRTDVDASLAALEELLNAVSSHYLNSTTRFSLGPVGVDAVSLLYLLRDGLQFRDDRLARIERGQSRPDDFQYGML